MIDLKESGSGLYPLRGFEIKDVELSDTGTMICVSYRYLLNWLVCTYYMS
jgi:hypothetical protein